MTKPAVVNKKKNVFHGMHKANKRRALKGKAPELEETKAMTAPQRRKRLTNPTANVNFSKKKLRQMNKGKPKDVEMEDMSEGVTLSSYSDVSHLDKYIHNVRIIFS